jgi:C-terminal processing protease CtpA/Prc
VLVENVVEGFPADEQGIKRGMVIQAIDDRPLDAAFLAKALAEPADGVTDNDADPEAAEPARIRRLNLELRAVRALLTSEDGAPRKHRLTLQRADDAVIQVEILARAGDVPTVEHYTLLPSGIGVLRLSRFDPSIRDRLERDIASAREHSRGLVIDLRANPGGEVGMFQWLVDQFIDRPVALGRMTVRLWNQPISRPIAGEPAFDPYLKPIALLIDRYTGSAAEWTAHALVELRDAVPVGERTCGCVVGVRREFVLPDGGVLRVAEAGFRSAHDRRMENDPLQPKITAEPTLAEARAGDDVQLRVAERALLAGTPATSKAH